MRGLGPCEGGGRLPTEVERPPGPAPACSGEPPDENAGAKERLAPRGSGRKSLPGCPHADPGGTGSSALTAVGPETAEEPRAWRSPFRSPGRGSRQEVHLTPGGRTAVPLGGVPPGVSHTCGASTCNAHERGPASQTRPPPGRPHRRVLFWFCSPPPPSPSGAPAFPARGLTSGLDSLGLLPVLLLALAPPSRSAPASSSSRAPAPRTRDCISR